MIEKLVERLAGETEVFGENLPQCRFVHHKSHMLLGREPGPTTKRLSYGTAIMKSIAFLFLHNVIRKKL
jgi:hypothetical protein